MLFTKKQKAAKLFAVATTAMFTLKRRREYIREDIVTSRRRVSSTSRITRENMVEEEVYIAHLEHEYKKFMLLEMCLDAIAQHRKELIGKTVPAFLRTPVANVLWMSFDIPVLKATANVLLAVTTFQQKQLAKQLMRHQACSHVDTMFMLEASATCTERTETPPPQTPPPPSAPEDPPSAPDDPPVCPPAPKKPPRQDHTGWLTVYDAEPEVACTLESKLENFGRYMALKT